VAVVAPATAATAWLTEVPSASDSAGGGSLASWGWAPETMPHTMQQQPPHASADDGQPGLQPAGLLPAGLGFGQGGDAVCVPLRCVPCSRHGNTCILLRMGLLRLFDGKADIVDLVLRHFHGASGWDKARFDARMFCVQYGPAGDVIAIGDADGFIHLICAQTGEKILRLKGHR
jgi:hypothetical protein